MDLTIKELQKAAWDNSEEHGFHALPGHDFYKFAALLASEVGEMIHAYQKGVTVSEHGLPAVPEEMADIIIRIADAAQSMGIDLEEIIRAKMAYNKGRPYLHGGEK